MNITIITAAFRLKGLQRAIASIDNQTYKKWQHIIVNDNVSDIRYKLTNITRGSFKRYWIDLGIRTHYWGGFARNIGAMIAFSYIQDRDREWDDEWICFLDDDNLWYPDHLETLVKAHEEHPEATLIGVDMEVRGYKDKNYKKIAKCAIFPNMCDLGSFLYNRKLFEKYGYFRPRIERKITYDFELISRMAKGEGKEKIHIVHKPTFIYFHKEH